MKLVQNVFVARCSWIWENESTSGFGRETRLNSEGITLFMLLVVINFRWKTTSKKIKLATDSNMTLR